MTIPPPDLKPRESETWVASSSLCLTRLGDCDIPLRCTDPIQCLHLMDEEAEAQRGQQILCFGQGEITNPISLASVIYSFHTYALDLSYELSNTFL